MVEPHSDSALYSALRPIGGNHVGERTARSGRPPRPRCPRRSSSARWPSRRPPARPATCSGRRSPAKGTPVKIGLITDGKTAGTDNSIETPVAEAAVKWINQYRNGVGGHPIELDICVTDGEPAKTRRLRQPDDPGRRRGRDLRLEPVPGVVDTVARSRDPGLHRSRPATPASRRPASTFVFGPGSAALENLIIGAAKAKPKAKKVTVVVIDVPAATRLLQDEARAVQKAGLDVELVPVRAGTADMTPQMQKVVSDNPKGVVFVLGNDSFCIAAFNGLRTAGLRGQRHRDPAVPQRRDPHRGARRLPRGHQDLAPPRRSTPRRTRRSSSTTRCSTSSVRRTSTRAGITGISMFQGIGGFERRHPEPEG